MKKNLPRWLDAELQAELRKRFDVEVKTVKGQRITKLTSKHR